MLHIVSQMPSAGPNPRRCDGEAIGPTTKPPRDVILHMVKDNVGDSIKLMIGLKFGIAPLPSKWVSLTRKPIYYVRYDKKCFHKIAPLI